MSEKNHLLKMKLHVFHIMQYPKILSLEACNGLRFYLNPISSKQFGKSNKLLRFIILGTFAKFLQMQFSQIKETMTVVIFYMHALLSKFGKIPKYSTFNINFNIQSILLYWSKQHLRKT